MSQEHFVFCARCGKLVAVVDDRSQVTWPGGQRKHAGHLGPVELSRDRLRELIRRRLVTVETQLTLT